MLISLAIFLCPTSHESASKHYYSAVASVTDIPKYDWCSFILDWLVDGIVKFHNSKGVTRSLGGCFFVLVVTYFEYINAPHIVLREDFPCIRIWDDYMIEEYLALERINGDDTSFGLLEEEAKTLRECLTYYLLTHPSNEKFDSLVHTKRILSIHGVNQNSYN